MKPRPRSIHQKISKAAHNLPFTYDIVILNAHLISHDYAKSRRHHVGWESKRALKQSLRSKKSPQKADTIAIAGADMPESSEHHTIVWEEPGRLSRLFSNITWFCPRNPLLGFVHAITPLFVILSVTRRTNIPNHQTRGRRRRHTCY